MCSFGWYYFCNLFKDLRFALVLIRPAIFSTVVVTLSTMFIQESVNRYGSTVVGPYTVDMKVEKICFYLAFSIGLSKGVFCGQNIGVGDEKRTVRGFHAGLLIAVIYCSVMAVISYIFTPWLVRIFLQRWKL